MQYDYIAIAEKQIPQAVDSQYQYLIDTYVSEANKVVSIWRTVPNSLLGFKPHEKSNDIQTIMKHQLLSERRFFAQFVGTQEMDVETLLPQVEKPEVKNYIEKYLEQIHHRLPQLANANHAWWHEEQPFFGLERERIWIFWRRVLHTAHHRTQMQLYLRLSDSHVPAIYGPSGDVNWDGADPTYSVDAAKRK